MERVTKIAGLIAVAAAVASSVAAGAPDQVGNGSLPVIVRNVSELQEALVPGNAGERILVQRGSYLLSSPLIVPDGAALVGEGVMLGDDQPDGFAPGTETTIQAAGTFGGDVLTLGNNSSLKNLAVSDSAGRSGNVIGLRSHAPGDTVAASITDCEITTPNPAAAAPDGPIGRGVAVVTQNPNFAAAPPPHDGAHLALVITHSLIRATGNGNALFAVNFASQTQISLQLRDNVFVGGLDANGGVPRPEAVSFASMTIASRSNLYVSNGLAPWRLGGGSSAPLPFAGGPTLSNRLSVESMDDRLDALSIGIAVVGGRRGRAIDGSATGNSVSLHIRGLTLRTVGSNASDLSLAGAASSGEFPPGDHNTLMLDMRGSTGSGERLNVYANTLGPLLPENAGAGNALRVAGTAEAFSERNSGFVPEPPAEFFSG